MIAGTLQTDPRSGGQTKKSGVNPLPILEESMCHLSVLNYAMRCIALHCISLFVLIEYRPQNDCVTFVCLVLFYSSSDTYTVRDIFRSFFHRAAWAQIRDEGNKDVDWLIAGYENGSKTNIGLLKKGNGGLEACAKELPDNEPVFGGCRLNKKGRFVSFYYCGEGTSVMKKGRAGMHKNGKPTSIHQTEYFFVFYVFMFEWI